MTDITLFGGNKVSLKDRKQVAAALNSAGAHGGMGGALPDGGVYISFSGKTGRYSIGEKKEDSDGSEIWLLNIYGIEAGWICWKGGRPAAKRLASIYGDPVPEPDMTEHGPFNSDRGEGWYAAKAWQLRSIDRGIQGYYSTNTVSAIKALADLEKEVARRVEEGEPAWPLIQLDKTTFPAQGQVNYKPVLNVYGWLGDNQVAAMSEMADIDEIADSIDDLIVEAEAEARSNVDNVLGAPTPPSDIDDDNDDVDDKPDTRSQARVRRPAPASAASAAQAGRRRRAAV